MRDILVLMHDDAGQQARFQAALDVTRALDGHLTCLDVALQPEPEPLAADCGNDSGHGSATTMLVEGRHVDADNSAHSSGHFQARLCREDMLWDWIDAIDDFAPCLRTASDLSDLIVVNRKLHGEWAPDMLGVAGDTVVRSGTPLLAVPGQARRFNAAGKVLVAWNGSAAAAAAMRAATPLLRLARRVEIVEIIDRDVAGSAADAVAYLERHGIHPTIRRETAGGRAAGDVLAALAEDGGYACVVMGGFGHRQFLDKAFGGVSRRLLSDCNVPIFMAH